MDYHVPKESPYAVLETYLNMDENSKVLHVLNFGGTSSLTVGRCSESNMKISDSSVSRLHSEIVFSRNKFYQMDLQSKFGTLKIFRKPLKVMNSLMIQSGCSVLKFKFCPPKENC